MKPNTSTDTRPTGHTGARARVAGIWVALAAATFAGCGGGGTHTTAAATSGASRAGEASSTTPADATPSPDPCVAQQHFNRAATRTRTQTSRLLRYQMDYPAGWRLETACRPWHFGEPGDQSVPGAMDVYQSPGRPAFVVSSQRIPAGMTVAKYLPTYMRGQPPNEFCWPEPRRWPVLHIAGHVARLRGQNTFCNVTEAVTVVGDRAYVFTGYTNRHGCCLFNQARFDAFLASVTFPPTAG